MTYSNLDLEANVVNVVYKPKQTSEDKIRIWLIEIGYDEDSLMAIPSAVEKLLECCKPNNPFHIKKEDDPDDH